MAKGQLAPIELTKPRTDPFPMVAKSRRTGERCHNSRTDPFLGDPGTPGVVCDDEGEFRVEGAQPEAGAGLCAERAEDSGRRDDPADRLSTGAALP